MPGVVVAQPEIDPGVAPVVTAVSSWKFIFGTSYDVLSIRGPHTVIDSTQDVICVRTGYNGSDQHFGATAGVGYKDFSLLVRFSDFSGNLDTIEYEFLALGLEIGYRYRPFADISGLDGIGLLLNGNLDARINTVTEGVGSNRQELRTAPSFATRLGIGVDYQFQIGGISIGPEYQFKKSWTDLSGNDPIFADFNIFGIKISFGGSSDESATVPKMNIRASYRVTDNQFVPCPGIYAGKYWDYALGQTPHATRVHPFSFKAGSDGTAEGIMLPRGSYRARISKMVRNTVVESDIVTIDHGTNAQEDTPVWEFKLTSACEPDVYAEIMVYDSQDKPCYGTYEVKYWDAARGINTAVTVAQLSLTNTSTLRIPVPPGQYMAKITKRLSRGSIESNEVSIGHGQDLTSTKTPWIFKLKKKCQ